MGEQLRDPILRVVLDAEQDVGEIDLRVDVVPLARGDERVENREAPPSAVVAEEERIFSQERDDPQRRLRCVVVDRDERVMEERDEARSLVFHVAERFAHRALGLEERRVLLPPRE